MATPILISRDDATELLARNGYIVQAELGSGGQGRVYLCTSADDPEPYAVKISLTSALSEQEITSLKCVWNPHVINLYKTFINNDCRFDVFEYCPGGSLRQLIISQDLTHGEKLQISREILEAVRACHDSGIAHLDIKPPNILIDKHGRVKLADFGLSQQPGDCPVSARRGSLAYMAPEIIARECYNPFPADIWSLGVTFYQLHSGRLPWPSDTAQLIPSIRNGLQEWDSRISPEMFNVLMQMVCIDPLARPTIHELITNSVFHGQSLVRSSLTRRDNTRIGERPTAPQRASTKFVVMLPWGRPYRMKNVRSYRTYGNSFPVNPLRSNTTENQEGVS
jgi:serine/threonine protein kinase